MPDEKMSDNSIVDDSTDEPVIRLSKWCGPWPDDDPDANFKQEIADYSRLDPLVTIKGMSDGIDVPAGAVVRYVLARWATGGSAGLLEVGPEMVDRLMAPILEAEEAATDEAKLAAYEQVRHMLSWLKAPLESDTYYTDE